MSILLSKFMNELNNEYILLVTSNSKEKESVNKHIVFRESLNIGITTHGSSIGILKYDKHSIFVIHITGTSGYQEQTSISRIISDFLAKTELPKPSLTLLLGICWGNPIHPNNKIEIGHILISNNILSINKQHYMGKDTLYQNSNFTSNISNETCEYLVQDKVHIGTLASLEALFKSTEKRDSLLSEHPSIIGGEMEAFGIIPSLTNNFIPWLVIKSVSDYGDDDFNRDEQVNVLDQLMNNIHSIIYKLVDLEVIKYNQENTDQMLSILIGKRLKLHRSDFNIETLNDYLSIIISPIIHSKLAYYQSSPKYNKLFINKMCGLILEVIQNSFKHAGADEIVVEFNSTNIIIHGNDNFDLNNFESVDTAKRKGGYDNWSMVQTYINEKSISYTFKKQRHNFTFNNMKNVIYEIMNNCTVTVKQNTIGSGFKDRVLIYDDTCKEVYVNLVNIYMMSKIRVLLEEVNELLEKGLSVIIRVDDESYMQNYKNYIQNLDRVKFIIN